MWKGFLAMTWAASGALPASAEAPAPAPQAPLARCTGAAGDARVRRGADPWDALVVGEELREGDKIKAGKLSMAQIDLAGGGLRLSDEALFELKAAPDNRPLIFLESGTVRGFLERSASDDPSPSLAFGSAGGSRASLEVRGSSPVQLRLAKTERGVEVAVLQGEAALRSSETERPLRAGQAVDLAAGGIEETRQLMPPPERLDPGADERFFCPGLVVRLAWSQVIGATRYRVQVANEPSFQSLALDTEGAKTHALFMVRKPQRYAWRVAASDESGRWSDFSDPRPIQCEPEAPQEHLLTPLDGATASYYDAPPAIVFSWEPVPGAKAYRLVVAKGADLHSSAVETRMISEPGIEMDGLTAGDYHWGVYVDDAWSTPLFLAPRKLTVKQSKVRIPASIKHWGG